MKTRLDVYLVEQLHMESREKSKAYIMAGKVYINGQKATKAGDVVKPDDVVEFRGDKLPFVSRGGLKLQKAMLCYNIHLEEKICMDVGASTGGFTDCMLQQGAKKVYAIDVGYGQLAWKLRQHPHVVNLERTNIRYVTEEQVPDKIDFTSVDVSFISLKLVLPVVYKYLHDLGEALCLIKPQFEAGKEKVGKKGVVKDPAVQIEVIEKTIICAKEIGFYPKTLTYSPIKGPEGNIEFLIYLGKEPISTEITGEQVREVVTLAQNNL